MTTTNFNNARDGSFALVSLASSKADRRNKIWSVHERRMMDEFGNRPSITVPAATQDTFYSYMMTKDCRYELFKINFYRENSENGGGGNEEYDGSDKDDMVSGNVGNVDSEVAENEEEKDEFNKEKHDICHQKINLLCEKPNTTVKCGVAKVIPTCTHKITSLHVQVNRLAQKPFITCEDGWLVSLTTDQSFRKGHFLGHMIAAYRIPKGEADISEESFSTKSEDILQVYPSTLSQSATAIKQILRLHRHPTSKDSIIVLFSNQPSTCCCSQPEEVCDEVEVKPCSCEPETPPCYIPPFYNPFPPQLVYKTCYCTGFLILDLSRVEVDFIIEDLLPPCTYLDRVIISRDVTKLYDSHSNIYNLCCKGMWKGVIEPVYPPGFKVPKSDDLKGDVEERFGWPMSVMLKDTLLLYLKNDYLTLVRLKDFHIIGRICVHTPITALAVACDERSIYVGGLDGNVSSYVVVDGGDLEGTIEKIESRRAGLECPRVWDGTGKYAEYLYKSGDIAGGRSILGDEALDYFKELGI